MKLTTAWLLLLTVAVENTQSPTVDLGYARYQGTVNGATGNTEFLGIRYAAPPTGDLRWKEPQPPKQDRVLQLANSHPKMCYQAPGGSNSVNPLRNLSDIGGEAPLPPPPEAPDQSEDCLFLNVYTPRIAGTTPLPVVVWIHGGGYIVGSASQTSLGPDFQGIYDGNDLIARAQGKAVAVIIQYRLGVFGFLPGKQVKQHGALNAGLLDQQFALKWVRQHIRKFGGDPKKVTIWGESAGAGSVLLQLVANGASTQPKLFNGAILSSSVVPSTFPFDHPTSEYAFTKTARLAGCSGKPNPLKCLRAANVDLLRSINDHINTQAFYGSPALSPVVDGHFLKGIPTKSFQTGKFNTKHVMVVRNTHEGLPFVNPNITSLREQIWNLFPTISARQATSATALYNASGLSVFEQGSQVQSEALFICPHYLVSRTLDGKVYQGHFAIPPSIHTDDIRYYFPGSHPGPPPFNDVSFVNAFAGSFLNFVRTQDPNQPSDPQTILPRWPKWTRYSPLEMVFNRVGDAPDIRALPSNEGLRQRCEFWTSISSSIFQ